MSWVAGVAAVGAGVIGGVFFAFSVSIMPAFARLAPTHGTAVMQAINITIVRAPFLIVFIGTVLACVAQVIVEPTDLLGWLGAALYVLGGFGLTMVANVPMNNRLMTVDPEAPDDYWQTYASRWTMWNHVRTVACIGAAAAMTFS